MLSDAQMIRTDMIICLSEAASLEAQKPACATAARRSQQGQHMNSYFASKITCWFVLLLLLVVLR